MMESLAERKGFEPSKGDKALTPLAGERLQPLGHLSVAGNARKFHVLQDMKQGLAQFSFCVVGQGRLARAFPDKCDALKAIRFQLR
jgi:hypothetical protein